MFHREQIISVEARGCGELIYNDRYSYAYTLIAGTGVAEPANTRSKVIYLEYFTDPS
jgi:hypothetical protein